MLHGLISRYRACVNSPVHIAPLVVLRIVFGLILFFSTIRFMTKGWVKDFYILPKFHFTFYGFEWVKPLAANGMYALFALMALACLCIAAGCFYKISCGVFFLCFTYVELIDITYYLNHYYFVSIIAFLLLLVPAHRYFSLDVLRKPSLNVTHVPAWTINIFKLQLFIVYFMAGISKLTADWLLHALPLRIWLPANAHLPWIGYFLEQTWVAYAFSWFGAVFDLTIVFFLLKSSTRTIAYFFVILFHVFTAWFFKIGMFPLIMMGMTLIFFSEGFHLSVVRFLQRMFVKQKTQVEHTSSFLKISPFMKKAGYALLTVFFILQLIVPFRFLLYPGKLLWTEQGYRFSWRVMLMEKSGTAYFYVTDAATGKSSEVVNSDFLTPFQERMMVTQPDMLLQYAHYLKKEYQKKGIKNPLVTVESYVTLNGSGTRPFVKKDVDLGSETESFADKKWILPY